MASIFRSYNDSYLYASFAEGGFRRESLARRDAGVVGSFELLFKLFELFGAEGGPISPELWLLGSIEASVIGVAICDKIFPYILISHFTDWKFIQPFNYKHFFFHTSANLQQPNSSIPSNRNFLFPPFPSAFSSSESAWSNGIIEIFEKKKKTISNTVII